MFNKEFYLKNEFKNFITSKFLDLSYDILFQELNKEEKLEEDYTSVNIINHFYSFLGNAF